MSAFDGKTPPGRVAAIITIAVALGVGLALAVGRVGSGDARPVRLVHGPTLEAAITSRVPARPTLTDEIRHFERRLEARDEAFAHRRLLAARLLRFRAYGRLDDLEKAEEHLSALEVRGYRPASLLVQLAAVHLVRHEFSSAVDAARQAVRAPEANADARLRLFDAYWATGRYEAAESLLAGPLMDTASVAFMSRKARVLDRQGRVATARDLFRRVMDRVNAYAEPAPVRGWALVELGHFEHHAGDPEAAIRRYREALEVLPGSPAALEGLAAVAYGVDRDLETATRLYRAALESGGHLDIMPTLARIERELGREAAARRTTEAFIRRAIADPRRERWYRRSLALVMAERPETACRAVELARLDLADRQDAGAWDALAWSLYGTGDLTSAWGAAREAVAGGVPEPGTALRSGIIARAAGRDESAERLLAVALEGATELGPSRAELARRLLDGEEAGPAPSPPTRCRVTS